MGLEIAEIMMDIEEYFGIDMVNGEQIDPTVMNIVNVVINNVRKISLFDRLHEMSDAHERNGLLIDRKIYNLYALKYGLLPIKFYQNAMLPNTFEEWSESVREKVQHITNMSDLEISEQVKSIICDRLKLASVNDEDHLIKDLNAG